MSRAEDYGFTPVPYLYDLPELSTAEDGGNVHAHHAHNDPAADASTVADDPMMRIPYKNLDALTGETVRLGASGDSLQSVPGTDEIVIATTESSQLQQGLLSWALQGLRYRTQTVLELRYGLLDGRPMTRREIGEQLSSAAAPRPLTETSVARIERQGLAELREMLAGTALDRRP